ncbi:MAG: antibiotic biosynthesis monooxygenase [Sphingomonadales bacterium]|nr:antibiotic biosynthesis monooxygenase [Sphingomonadales bacterium]MDE2168501.1 antibiotic biosynthesis monooxygenase [Sphingomonadales bacterium]
MSGIDVVAVLVAKPGHEAALEAVLQACVAPSMAEPGCIFYRLNRDSAHAGRFVFLERWADEEAIATHEATSHFQALAAALPEHLDGEALIMKLETR